MFFRLLHICSILIFTQLCVWAESRGIEELMKDEEYIKASLVIVSPGDAIYSAGGHLSLRMECPSQSVDYIYEFDAYLDSDESIIFQFLNGTLKGNYVRLYTSDFLSKVHSEDRRLNEYTLNLTPEQEVSLWERLDSKVDSDSVYAFIPSKNNCCSMILHVIESALHTEMFSSQNVYQVLNGSGRKYLNDFFGNSQWTGLLWNILLGIDFDQSQKPIFLFYPKNIGMYMPLIINPINQKPLINENSIDIGFVKYEKGIHAYITPQIVFTILFFISAILTYMNIKGKAIDFSHWFDFSLIGICTLIGCILWYIFFASILKGNISLNLLMLVFSPIPILLLFLHNFNAWIWYLKISKAIILILLISINFLLQIQLYCLWLFMMVILIRAIYNIHSKRSMFNHKTVIT